MSARKEKLPVPAEFAREIKVLAIGCSAGGFESLQKVLPALAPKFPAPVVVVLHLPADKESFLPQAFERRAALRAVEVEDKMRLEPGTIYFAPPGYHFLVEPDGTAGLSVEEPVHYSRPSIDVLFESVAQAYGPHALAIVLSGANADGAEGMRKILEEGGYGLVENPAAARYGMMPAAAAELAQPQAVWSLAEMAAWLGEIKPRD